MIAPSEHATASPVRAYSIAVRCVLRIALCAAILPCLSQCASKGYKAANYSDAKLATPPHNLSQRDYPFDASGNYRKDWVKDGSRTASGNNVNRPKITSSKKKKSSTSSRVASTPPAPIRTPTPTTQSSSPPPPRIATTTTRTTPPATPTRASSPPPPPAPKPKPAAPAPAPKPAVRYHTVEPKQTLWALSQKYGTSVAALKKANGLTSDNIRIGQSLRIP